MVEEAAIIDKICRAGPPKSQIQWIINRRVITLWVEWTCWNVIRPATLGAATRQIADGGLYTSRVCMCVEFTFEAMCVEFTFEAELSKGSERESGDVRHPCRLMQSALGDSGRKSVCGILHAISAPNMQTPISRKYKQQHCSVIVARTLKQPDESGRKEMSKSKQTKQQLLHAMYVL